MAYGGYRFLISRECFLRHTPSALIIVISAVIEKWSFNLRRVFYVQIKFIIITKNYRGCYNSHKWLIKYSLSYNAYNLFVDNILIDSSLIACSSKMHNGFDSISPLFLKYRIQLMLSLLMYAMLY